MTPTEALHARSAGLDTLAADLSTRLGVNRRGTRTVAPFLD